MLEKLKDYFCRQSKEAASSNSNEVKVNQSKGVDGEKDEMSHQKRVIKGKTAIKIGDQERIGASAIDDEKAFTKAEINSTLLFPSDKKKAISAGLHKGGNEEAKPEWRVKKSRRGGSSISDCTAVQAKARHSTAEAGEAAVTASSTARETFLEHSSRNRCRESKEQPFEIDDLDSQRSRASSGTDASLSSSMPALDYQSMRNRSTNDGSGLISGHCSSLSMERYDDENGFLLPNWVHGKTTSYQMDYGRCQKMQKIPPLRPPSRHDNDYIMSLCKESYVPSWIQSRDAALKRYRTIRQKQTAFVQGIVPELRPPSCARMDPVIPADLYIGWTGSNKLQPKKTFKQQRDFPSSPEKSVKKNLVKNEQPLPAFFENIGKVSTNALEKKFVPRRKFPINYEQDNLMGCGSVWKDDSVHWQKGKRHWAGQPSETPILKDFQDE